MQALATRPQVEEAARTELAGNRFDSSALQSLAELDSLIASASGMAIWPLDRKTCLRYAGLLGTPLVPLIAQLLPRSLAWVKGYLGLGP